MAAKLSWQELLLCSAPAAILAEALDNCSRALLASVMALASSAVEEAIRSAACCCLATVLACLRWASARFAEAAALSVRDDEGAATVDFFRAITQSPNTLVSSSAVKSAELH